MAINILLLLLRMITVFSIFYFEHITNLNGGRSVSLSLSFSIASLRLRCKSERTIYSILFMNEKFIVLQKYLGYNNYFHHLNVRLRLPPTTLGFLLSQAKRAMSISPLVNI